MISHAKPDLICADNALLLSDVHLSTARPDITTRLLACLQTQLRDVEQLFILGDLFEVWIGDDAADALAHQLSSRLAAIAASGVHIYFMHGNRDFLLGTTYADAAGMQLLADPCVVQSGEQRLLLAHGDAWCVDDHAYQALRRQLRDPAWQVQFLALPQTQRHAMAQQARDASQAHTSQAHNNQTSTDIMDVNAATVAQVFREHAIATIIHGHTHRPAEHDHDGCKRHVLGDWHQHDSWLRLRNGQLKRHGQVISSE